MQGTKDPLHKIEWERHKHKVLVFIRSPHLQIVDGRGKKYTNFAGMSNFFRVLSFLFAATVCLASRKFRLISESGHVVAGISGVERWAESRIECGDQCSLLGEEKCRGFVLSKTEKSASGKFRCKLFEYLHLSDLE